jgi:AraC family transcriptional regulator of adaptative response/methylated-DNA-[protein]-cysteine methyltransferase
MKTNEQSAPPATATRLDPRWAHVVARAREADGRFWYSVRTTGVYCRPSCAARLPRPENVRFHATPEDAERAGFRPCKRCGPRATTGDDLLDDGMLGDGVLRFSIGECVLGQVLVARGERGLRAILLGDDRDGLLAELQARFPGARRLEAPVELADTLRAVAGFVEAPQRRLRLLLDARGNDFQQRVWRALRELPAGTTASYAEIARRIGAPRAVRAVATACAANPLAVAIPCHRVVRSDGALSGYRWGVARKRALLEREARA